MVEYVMDLFLISIASWERWEEELEGRSYEISSCLDSTSQSLSNTLSKTLCKLISSICDAIVGNT